MARRKKRHSKRNSRRVRRNRGHRRLKRNPSTVQWLLIAGGAYLGYRWWMGRQHPALPAATATAPAVVQPTPPPAVSGLGTLVVV